MIDRLHSYGKEVSTWRANLSLITRGAAVIDPYRNTYHIYIQNEDEKATLDGG